MLDTRFESGPFAGLTRGHYRVALIDPPWRFQAWSHRGEGKSPSRYYRCQSLEEISTLPVGQLMAADSVLFLWVVQIMLPEALHVLEAWNFGFKTVGFIWLKVGDVPRIELFAREQRPGWSAWGDQLRSVR